MAPESALDQRTTTRPGNAVPPHHDPLLTVKARFGYFVVQAQAARVAGAFQVSGVLENLGTGEKQVFHGCAALARLMDEWGQRSAVTE